MEDVTVRKYLFLVILINYLSLYLFRNKTAALFDHNDASRLKAGNESLFGYLFYKICLSMSEPIILRPNSISPALDQ